MMHKLNYLNLGCGLNFHKEWINVDMTSNSPYVISHNLLKKFPFHNNRFDVIYNSHVLEHFPKEKASNFVRECFRVLKPGGIMRVCVPDLENIVNEYLKQLHENTENQNSLSEANYDWILLEMYDQTVRNHSGGQMGELLIQPELINEQYVFDRIGYIGRFFRNDYLSAGDQQKTTNLKKFVKRGTRYIIKRMKHIFLSEAQRIGEFRLGGDIHQWMYDRYSLSRLLRKSGFDDIEIKTSYESNIPQWDKYELDVKDGVVIHPTSLFMEARKPR
jgi:predicted SAM-dependent methyltransferase